MSLPLHQISKSDAPESIEEAQIAESKQPTVAGGFRYNQ
jgi:hypothetical protein